MSEIADRVARIREQMAHAAAQAGRDEKEILLLAATKMNDAQRVREAIAAGVDICGENRVQELQEKNAQGAYEGCRCTLSDTCKRIKPSFWWEQWS